MSPGVVRQSPVACLIFALYFFHNYQALLAKGSGPYFYLPKTQSWQEAAWWSEVFSYAEDRFNLPRGTIKATLLIETLPACSRWMKSFTRCVTILLV